MFDDIGMPGAANVTVDGASGQVTIADNNKGVTPIFFMEPVKNAAKTAEEGRPIFDLLERVMLRVAGDSFTQIVHPVDEAQKARFPEQYRRWKEQHQAMTVSGTPLRQWSALSPANVAEFEALGIFNVEGLAGLSDVNITRSQGLREWRAKAEAYLMTAKDTAVSVRFAEENMHLKSEIADLKRQMEELAAKVLDANKHHRKA